MTRATSGLSFVVTCLLLGGWAGDARAFGESLNGFPSWAERVHLQLTNRARVDPQLEMTQCGASCAEAACYDVVPPLVHRHEASRAARFHAAEMVAQGYFAHTSDCQVVSNIDSLYPGSCNGEASCACVPGTENGACAASSSCTTAGQRVSLFGAGYSGEIIASGGSPNQAFYLWLYESSGSTTCQFTMQNGHRWLLLTSGGSVGFGVDGYHVGDFSGGGQQHKIPSGAHWPRQSSSVEAWANWYDSAGPSSALINVDGDCTALQLTRGSETNGSYMVNLTGFGSGCHRYFFLFRDSADQVVTYPEAGSLGIGPEASCPDWSTDRPPTGASCSCTPQCAGKQCGDDTCGGSCGNCAPGETCQGDQCVGGGTGGTGGTGSSSSSSGTGGGTTSSSGVGGEVTSSSGAGGASGSGVGGEVTSSGSGGSTGGSPPLGADPDVGVHGRCECRAAGHPTGPRSLAWLLPLLATAATWSRRRSRRGWGHGTAHASR